MQITIEVKDGATPEAIARALRFQANLMDGIEPKKAASNAMTAAPTAGKKKAKPADEDEEIEESEDEEIEDEETDDSEDEEDTDADSESDSDEEDEEESDDSDSDDADEDDEEAEDEDEPAPKKAKGKAKPKLSAKEEKLLKEVNTALKTRAKKTSFDKVKVWLKKKFKVESINHLKPSQFAAVIKASKAA